MNRKRTKGLPFILCCLFLSVFFIQPSATAQSNLNCIKVSGEATSIKLDSLPVDSSSIRINPPAGYKILNNQIVLENADMDQEYTICYRTLSPLLKNALKNRDISIYEEGQKVSDINPFITETEKPTVFNTPILYKSGTLSRGITIGNRQSLFVNSSLNLQLDGKLADDLFINAAITDQNVPYQPEGNTQQIRDFDNVYIRLYNDNINVRAGDLVLENPDRNNFLKYYKNLQGLQVGYKNNLGKWISETTVSGAFSKGKFASTQVEPIEGVSGPYKLRGAQNERFIIVIANSEKVFIDGERVERGFDRDYTIDYNLGEITFNPNIVITRFTRIRVDFEYAEQNYSRSNLFASQTLSTDKVTLYGEFYREKDNPDNSFGFDLGTDDLNNLNLIGDNLDAAFISGVDTTTYDPDRIQYTIRDTVINGQSFNFYERVTENTQPLFSIVFSEVPAGLGSYIRISSTSNGSEYQWVGPGNGNFEPVAPISTPNLRQMSIVGGSVKITTHESIFQEMAFSNHDQNLLSDRDDNDNIGMAWKGGISSAGRSLPGFEDYVFGLKINYEYDQSAFRPIDRFRYIEFDRDWNYLSPFDSIPATESIFHGELEIKKNTQNSVNYQIDHRTRGDQLTGIQQKLDIEKDFGFLHYSGNHFLMQTDQLYRDANWYRSFSDLSIGFNKLKIGAFYNLDQNSIFFNETDSIINSAMYFQESGVYLKDGDSTDFQFEVKGGLRSDKLPSQGELLDFTETEYVQLSLATPSSSKQQVRVSANFREIQDQFQEDESRRIVQGSIIADNSIWKGFITSNLNYGTSNARELRREYVFTRVGSGQGTHTWRDENSDGIQDLNEFYEAINPDERNFIKLFVPTDEYIEAYQTQYNHSLNISSPRSLEYHGIWKWVSKVSLLTNWNINRKTTSTAVSKRLNPFISLTRDDLLFEQSIKRYNLFYNRSGRGIGLELGISDRSSKQLNQNGFEALSDVKQSVVFRWNFNRTYQFILKGTRGNRDNASDFLNSRNFLIKYSSYEPGFTWQPNQNIRLGLDYGYKNNENQFNEESNEFSSINEFGGNITWSNPQKGSFTSEFTYLMIDFEGDENTYLGYTLLEGLRPGNNMRFSANWQQYLNNGLQLTIQYFGRKSENQEMIHSGTMQLTAFF